MGGRVIRALMGLLAAITSFYMMVISVRIILTWFGGQGGAAAFLARFTDPYLDWFRRFPLFRVGYLDLSPLAALALLSLANQVFKVFSVYGRITVGFVLALIVQSLGSIATFLSGFAVIILILRLIAYLTSRNIYTPFWRAIDAVSQPLLYRVNRIFFGRRIVHYRTGLLVSIAALGGLYLLAKVLLRAAVAALLALPV